MCPNVYFACTDTNAFNYINYVLDIIVGYVKTLDFYFHISELAAFLSFRWQNELMNNTVFHHGCVEKVLNCFFGNCTLTKITLSAFFLDLSSPFQLN